MSKPTRRLGRGLDALVPDFVTLESAKQPIESQIIVNNDVKKHSPRMTSPETGDGEVSGFEIEIDSISLNNIQPRTIFKDDRILALADSIRRSGVLQPVAVRPVGDRYQLIAGERRWRAARLAGLRKIPAVVRQATDEQMLELALVENIQREDLTAIDRARAYRQFCDRFGLTVDQVAERVAENRTTVLNYLRLLELPEQVQELLTEHQISMGHARCLAGVSDEGRRWELARAIVEKGISVRLLEEIVRREREEGLPLARRGEQKKRPAASAHVREVQRRFEEALKTKVAVVEGKKKGSGRIMIQYYSLEDFDRIAEKLGVRFE